VDSPYNDALSQITDTDRCSGALGMAYRTRTLGPNPSRTGLEWGQIRDRSIVEVGRRSKREGCEASQRNLTSDCRTDWCIREPFDDAALCAILYLEDARVSAFASLCCSLLQIQS